MGYELWISPHTGIRRKGTTFKEVQSIFIDNITTKFIYEPIYSCKLTDKCKYVKEALIYRDFDVVGVIDAECKVIGYVEREALAKGLIENYFKKAEPRHLISDSTPISKLLNILSDTFFSFVLVEDRVEGIVTRADINKPVVRIYLFGIISLFELHLNFWITEYHRNDSWMGFLKKERLEEAEEIFAERKGKNEELSLLECLQLCDKKGILKDTQPFLVKFGFSKTKFERFLRHVEIVRNELAHSQNSIIANLEWIEFYQAISAAEDFLHTSEKIVEEKVNESVK